MTKIKRYIIILLFFNIILTVSSYSHLQASSSRESWEDQGLDWYYDNLDDDDRRKIRQAMDYVIPREQITNNFWGGLAVPLATEIGQNTLGYDESVHTRKYNISRAKQLLKEVFGKTYTNEQNLKVNSSITTTPYFTITFISRASCVARYEWASFIALSFMEIGINVEIKWLGNFIIPRIYLEPKGIGYNFAHGGVDAWFIRNSIDVDPDLSSKYFVNEFAPNGSNAFWIENQEITDIINGSLTTPNLNERLNYLRDYQHWFYWEVPKSIILREMNIFAIDKDIQGFYPFLIGKGWCFNNWTISTETSLTYTIPGDFVAFNPLISNNYFDLIPLRNIFGALAQRRGAYNLTHSVPQIAESWTSNEDGTTWEVKIRDGIKWSDGTNLTAEDVIFSYHSVFENAISSPYYELFTDQFPHKSTNIFIKPGTNDTIIFEFGSFYPYVESKIFTLPILKKQQWENIEINDWRTSKLNLGTNNDYPIGCGPYKISDINSNNIKLEINPFFDQTIFGYNPNATGGGIWFSNPTLEEINIVIEKDVTKAINGLASGVYNVIDAQMGLFANYNDLYKPNNIYNSKCVTLLDDGWHELNYNHYDPRWGMNAHDPREMYPDDYTSSNKIPFANLLILVLILLPLALAVSGHRPKFLMMKK